MTDRPAPDPSPADPDFELASAHLDGESTPDEAALVEGDAVLAALVEDLRGLVTSLDPGEAPAALMESHVAVALAAYDDERGSSPAAPVTALATARAERSRPRWYDRIPLGAVAAAILLVALVGGLSLVDFDGNEDDTAAVQADMEDSDESTQFGGTGDALQDGAGESAGTVSDGGASGGGGAVLEPTAGAERRAFEDANELAAFVSEELANRRATAAPSAGEDSTAGDDGDLAAPDAACDLQGVARTAAGPGTVESVLAAVVAGQPVSAFVIETSEGPELVVVDETTCAVTDQRALDG
jgi:hypothetical protein